MILVTGGTGLVGSHLLYQLALKNKQIVAIHRKTSNLDYVKKVFTYFCNETEALLLFNKIQWIEATINDIPALDKAFENIDYVYHCAAVVSFDSKDYHLMRKVNIEGTANVINLSLSHKVKKLVHISSIATIEKKEGSDQINEDNEWDSEKNNYGYAISKFGAEMEVWRGGQEGLNIAIVNPGVIFGSGFWQLGPNALLDKIYKGFKFYTKGITGFVTASDVAKVMVLLMNSSITNERFIVVNENKSFKDLMQLFAKNLAVKAPKTYAKPWLTEIVWRIESIKSKLLRKPALISKHSSRVSHCKYFYNSEKLKTILNFEFANFEQEIETICKNYLNDKK
jgi:nucleoside-diphosphate-sugar epimerase